MRVKERSSVRMKWSFSYYLLVVFPGNIVECPMEKIKGNSRHSRWLASYRAVQLESSVKQWYPAWNPSSSGY